VILLSADWDEQSKHVKSMISEMPATFPALKFCWVDCDKSEDLVDHFSVDSVPSLILVHPHKMSPTVLQGVTPEQVTSTIHEQNEFYTKLFEQEKQHAFRDIEDLVKSSPCFMFIKGTLDTPKCKFTRRLVESLKPFEYRNIKTLNILEDERIRQWLKFYSQWPTFP